MTVKTTTLIYFIILFSLNPYPANALSCKPLKDRIIAQCTDAICEQLIFVSDVKSFSKCKRRQKVIEPPTWAKSVIEYELGVHGFSSVTGIYELIISTKFHFPSKGFSKVHEYITAIENNGITPRYKRIVRKMKKIDEASIEPIHQQWKLTEQQQYKHYIFDKITTWFRLAVSFLLLLTSILWFIQWVNGNKKMIWLLLSLTIQSFLMYLSVFSASHLSIFKFILLIGIFIPGIWLFQLVLIYWVRLRNDKVQ